MPAPFPICIAGAGSIGCYVGGMLAAAGRDVHLLARPRVIADIHAHGLKLTAVDGAALQLPAEQLSLSDDPAMMKAAAVILITVKSSDTAELAGLIARHAAPDAVVVSLQNGVGNVALLRARLPQHRVLGGMVPFNVVSRPGGLVHRATSGDIVIEKDERDTAALLSVPHLAFRSSNDIAGVQWGKLMVNLSNALNALSNLPLRSQLSDFTWRRLFADQMAEGLAVLKAAGIRPRSPTAIPIGLTPWMLRLPDALFGVVLDRVIKVDANARSSMWEDLQHGRRTEVDYLQGVIIGMADEQGLDAPLARRVRSLVKAAEQAGAGSPGLQAHEIRGLG